MRSETNPVEAVQKTPRVSPARPVGFADNPMYQSQQKKKREAAPKPKEMKGKDPLRQPEDPGAHIDFNA